MKMILHKSKEDSNLLSCLHLKKRKTTHASSDYSLLTEENIIGIIRIVGKNAKS